jgi:hypothetical protein
MRPRPNKAQQVIKFQFGENGSFTHFQLLVREFYRVYNLKCNLDDRHYGIVMKSEAVAPV